MAPTKTPPVPKYEHQEFPKMLYRASQSGALDNVIVRSEEEMATKFSEGWVEHPSEVGDAQPSGPVSELEADTMRRRIEQLEAENEALKAKGKKGKKADDQ